LSSRVAVLSIKEPKIISNQERRFGLVFTSKNYGFISVEWYFVLGFPTNEAETRYFE